MKTKLLIATALTAVLSTGLYAACNGQGMMKKGMNNANQSCGIKSGKHMMMKKGYHKGQKGPMSLLRQLNLTAEQTQQIRDIKKDNPNLPIYAVVEDLCASGGYYIAAAADKIFVNESRCWFYWCSNEWLWFCRCFKKLRH